MTKMALLKSPAMLPLSYFASEMLNFHKLINDSPFDDSPLLNRLLALDDDELA